MSSRNPVVLRGLFFTNVIYWYFLPSNHYIYFEMVLYGSTLMLLTDLNWNPGFCASKYTMYMNKYYTFIKKNSIYHFLSIELNLKLPPVLNPMKIFALMTFSRDFTFSTVICAILLFLIHLIFIKMLLFIYFLKDFINLT